MLIEADEQRQRTCFSYSLPWRNQQGYSPVLNKKKNGGKLHKFLLDTFHLAGAMTENIRNNGRRIAFSFQR